MFRTEIMNKRSVKRDILGNQIADYDFRYPYQKPKIPWLRGYWSTKKLRCATPLAPWNFGWRCLCLIFITRDPRLIFSRNRKVGSFFIPIIKLRDCGVGNVEDLVDGKCCRNQRFSNGIADRYFYYGL